MSSNRTAEVTRALALVGCGYIYGATGWVCTQARIDAQAKQYPTYADTIQRYGPKWMGKKCFDCAQLTREAAKAEGISLPSGATSQWRASVWDEKGTIDTLPEDEARIHLFREAMDAKGKPTGKMAHTAVYCGDGTAVEARGHAHGVVRRKLSEGTWTHWARLAGAENAAHADDAEPPHKTLRKGAAGSAVVEAQELLIQAGYSLALYGADGKFGAETERAVKAFQQANALMPDGVIGLATWETLLSEVDQADDPTPQKRWYAVIPCSTETEAGEVAALYPNGQVRYDV